jgi:aryl-alcohol dehydrogenase-like predicted oxidoreductase
MRRLGFAAGVAGLGTWQLGADWGSVNPDDARATLAAALDAGRIARRARSAARG